MHAIIPKTRCQGRWKGDEDGTAVRCRCPYLHHVGFAIGDRCSFVGHEFEAWEPRRKRGCAWGDRPIRIVVEEGR